MLFAHIENIGRRETIKEKIIELWTCCDIQLELSSRSFDIEG